VVVEPKGGGAEKLDEAIRTYYRAIASGKGGLFLAVCRGKVSEGINFADANARAVVIVGIPFPNAMDAKVDLKKRYNEWHTKHGGKALVSGGEWYSLQAFRAMNQVRYERSDVEVDRLLAGKQAVKLSPAHLRPTYRPLTHRPPP